MTSKNVSRNICFENSGIQSYIPAILLPGGSLERVMWQTLYSKMV